MLSFFFFNDTATTEIYTLSLHDALPICLRSSGMQRRHGEVPHPSRAPRAERNSRAAFGRDRKSTRLNSSHVKISYAVFCLKKKKKQNTNRIIERLINNLRVSMSVSKLRL